MASKHDWHWTFGDGCHIHFLNGGDPIMLSSHVFTTMEGCATMSDANGGMNLYTDGRKLYNYNDILVPTMPASMGGNITSCHSAIIVPPAGGGSRYHIFAVDAWEPTAANAKPVTYTGVTAAGPVVITQQPVPLLPSTGMTRAAERLAAVQHHDCNKYWVVALYLDGQLGLFESILVASDAQPASVGSTAYQAGWAPTHQYCMKFSPDGTLLALASEKTIDIFSFNRTTGAIAGHSQVVGFTSKTRAYGLEFSPNGLYLYFTCYMTGEVRRHTIGPATSSANYSMTNLIGSFVTPAAGPYVGALQLGPNGKIYGAKVGQTTIFEIGTPDNPNPSLVAFNVNAVKAGGGTLVLSATCQLGLPTFVRTTSDCDDRCSKLEADVNAILEDRADLHNSMVTCKDGPPPPRQCHPLEIPTLRPQTYITWGNSKCDCIEGDDTEIMYLTVCNPYSNLTLSNLIVYQLTVVDANGNPVPNLPDGSPSIQLVPIGPYCFDDIAPCTCVTREFVLRLRGAPGGKYQIRVKGICFDACFHGDEEACFAFEVCKD